MLRQGAVLRAAECGFKSVQLRFHGRHTQFLLKTLPKFGDNPTKEQIESVMPWAEYAQKSCGKNRTTDSDEV